MNYLDDDLLTTSATAPTRPSRMPLLVCGLTAVLALAACGSSSTPSSKSAPGSSATTVNRPATTASSAPAAASSPVPPLASAHAGGGYCSLVTADEARAVVGKDLAPGVSRTGTTPVIGGKSGSCLYRSVHPTTLTLVNLVVVGTKIPRSVFDTEINSNANKTTPVSGLGETAFGMPGIVTVYDHGLVLALEIIKNGKAVAATTIIALLRGALSRAGGLR